MRYIEPHAHMVSRVTDETGRASFRVDYPLAYGTVRARLAAELPAFEMRVAPGAVPQRVIFAAQLADCLVAVISQRLRFRADLNIRVPECEILMASHAVKSFIRNRDFFKIASAIETGADHGMWTLQRYRNWLDSRKNWYIPGQTPEATEGEAPAGGTSPAAPGGNGAQPIQEQDSSRPLRHETHDGAQTVPGTQAHPQP